MSKINPEKVVDVVRDAGGKVVGRTRLQKITYLLSVSGLEDEFQFVYKHYGPYSEGLANAARQASIQGLMSEAENQASWGGVYSTYSVVTTGRSAADSARQNLAREAANADAIELELAATAVFLAKEGYNDPWEETSRRKPEKTEGDRITRSKELYRKISSIKTPNDWPHIL